MSKRLIDANELISAMYYYEHNEGGLTAYDAQDIINKAPTIEPKQERCEYCKDGDFMGQRQMLGNDGKWHKILFCPNCGAEMGEREGE